MRAGLHQRPLGPCRDGSFCVAARSSHPTGAKLHVSGFSDDGLHVTDVWDSEQSFNSFMEQRLVRVMQEIGIQGHPDVKFFPMHGVFAPALGGNEQVSDL